MGTRQLAIDNRKSLMYRRPRFLEVLHAIREEMSREADYDVDLFAEMVRSGARPSHGPERVIRGFRSRAPRAEKVNAKPTNRRQRAKTQTVKAKAVAENRKSTRTFDESDV